MSTTGIIIWLVIIFVVYKAANWFVNRAPSSKEIAEINELNRKARIHNERLDIARGLIAKPAEPLPVSYRDQAKPSVQEQLDELKERLDAQDKVLAALVGYKRHQAHPVRLGPDEISDREIRELRVCAVGDPETPYLDDGYESWDGVGALRQPIISKGWKVRNGRG